MLIRTRPLTGASAAAGYGLLLTRRRGDRFLDAMPRPADRAADLGLRNAGADRKSDRMPESFVRASERDLRLADFASRVDQIDDRLVAELSIFGSRTT